MKKLLAILLLLTTLPTRPMDPTTQDIFMTGLAVASLLLVSTHHVYQRFNPTIEDFKGKKEARDGQIKVHPMLYDDYKRRCMKDNDYSRRCLEAGKMLEK